VPFRYLCGECGATIMELSEVSLKDDVKMTCPKCGHIAETFKVKNIVIRAVTSEEFEKFKTVKKQRNYHRKNHNSSGKVTKPVVSIWFQKRVTVKE